MNDLHITPEAADLYALGVLNEDERARWDRHAEQCDTCTAALGEASAVVEALEMRADIVPAPRSLHEGRRRFRRQGFSAVGLAAAAAVALIFLVRMLDLNSMVNHDDVALVALVHSHFNHAPFIAQRANAPAAKVMFARDGSWLFVVVDHPGMPLTIQGTDITGHASELGRIDRSTSPQSVFARPTQRIIHIELLDPSGVPVERATLAYPK